MKKKVYGLILAILVYTGFFVVIVPGNSIEQKIDGYQYYYKNDPQYLLVGAILSFLLATTIYILVAADK
jgi:hypothetical protein